MKTITNLNFVIPFFFANAPRPAAMVKGKIKFVTNEDHAQFGKVRIATDSFHKELNTDYITLEEAKVIVEKHGGIWVKENFDDMNVDDLREIKSQLSEEWIEGFNSWYNHKD